VISRTLFILIINALAGMLLLWSGARRLLQDRSYIAEAFPQMGLREILRGLYVLAFVLTAIFVAVAFVLYPEGDGYARGAQALYLLGWWGTIVLLVFIIFVGIRSSAPVPASAIVGLLVALVPAILFVSVPRFIQVFSVDGFDRAVIIGLALAAMSYTILRRLGRVEPAQ
jgi:predicted signal transduction protein with EAL and GGDEF domain